MYGLDGLDPGERHAILLAINEHADLLLMDERAGVRVAREHGLTVTGTLGILLHGERTRSAGYGCCASRFASHGVSLHSGPDRRDQTAGWQRGSVPIVGYGWRREKNGIASLRSTQAVHVSGCRNPSWSFGAIAARDTHHSLLRLRNAATRLRRSAKTERALPHFDLDNYRTSISTRCPSPLPNALSLCDCPAGMKTHRPG